ncbi:MAG: carbohydrate ABC transporter permease [Chloroflexi bacterium]|nr:carbohydrate ABC transporter permease [Chloroflexota bacterium]
MATTAVRMRASASSSRRTLGRGWVIATYATLVFFVLWTVVPFIWMFLASIKTNKEIYQDFTILPKVVYWGHYETLLFGETAGGGMRASARFSAWLRNSTIVALAVTTLSIVLGSFGAYAVTRLRFAGRGIMARGLIFTYLVPGSLLFIPLFQVVATLDLVDTLSALLLVYPSFTLPFCTWMLMSYFRSIPVELEEAALIDGCTRLGVLFRITMPLSAPAIAVVALFSFTQSWNEFLYALVFTNSVTTRTVTVGLTQMLGEDVFYWGQMMGGAIIAALPPVIMYSLAQRLVIRGLVGGAVKG